MKSPASTIYALDSTTSTAGTGPSKDGGAWVVDPPATRLPDGSLSITRTPTAGQYWWGGWKPSTPNDVRTFGHVWPWHGERVNAAFADGHVKALTIGQLTAGCDMEDSSAGAVFDRDAYLWDLE